MGSYSLDACLLSMFRKYVLFKRSWCRRTKPLIQFLFTSTPRISSAIFLTIALVGGIFRSVKQLMRVISTSSYTLVKSCRYSELASVKTATEVGVRAIQDHKVIEWNTCWKCRLSEGTDDM
jgi:hypothetical protein